MSPISLYIHIPFCVHRCGYCDFNTYAGLEAYIPEYSEALCQELEFIAKHKKQIIELHTIYFGGGTPSLLSISRLERILLTVDRNFKVLPDAEISLEANPGTISREYLYDLHSLGINRLSIGMQSADEEELKLLERQHSFVDVVNSLEWASMAGFKNINLDLIFALPGQEIKTWRRNLEKAILLEPNHLSLYSLTIEEGTPMFLKLKSGLYKPLDQDAAADMYELASDLLDKNRYHQYEISNWARMDENGELFSCKHNLQYWRSLPYLGVGAGAHGFINSRRTVNINAPTRYLQVLKNGNNELNCNFKFPQTPATKELLFIDPETEIGEMMMMGLRLVQEGIQNIEFQNRFGVTLQQRFPKQIERLINLGLIEWARKQNERLRITKKGRLLGNVVFREFI